MLPIARRIWLGTGPDCLNPSVHNKLMRIALRTYSNEEKPPSKPDQDADSRVAPTVNTDESDSKECLH